MRLQILALPAPPDQYPFALVVDEVAPDVPHGMADEMRALKDVLGARCVLIFQETADVA